MSKVESAKQYLKEADRLYKDIAMTKNENAYLRAKLDIAAKALKAIKIYSQKKLAFHDTYFLANEALKEIGITERSE